MVIKDIKDLKQIIDLCRKTGVESIKIDNVEMHLGAVPIKYTTNTTKSITSTYPKNVVTEETQITTDELTEEQLMFYSASNQDFNEQQ